MQTGWWWERESEGRVKVKVRIGGKTCGSSDIVDFPSTTITCPTSRALDIINVARCEVRGASWQKHISWAINLSTAQHPLFLTRNLQEYTNIRRVVK